MTRTRASVVIAIVGLAVSAVSVEGLTLRNAQAQPPQASPPKAADHGHAHEESVMPAWKGELSMNDRWAVIAYAHTLSGPRGPHVASQHLELKPKPKFVTGEGTVTALRPEKQQIVLEHGEIKGFMGAMTMGYKTNPTSLLNSVKPGDKVRFTIDTDARAITKIDKLQD